jgi:transcription elongation factor Elf1
MGSKVNFRNHARQALEQAKTQLAGDAPGRLRYAALELRLALEALAYDTAQSFEEELPESAYEQWQPHRLVETLVEVDPGADRTVRVAFREEGCDDQQWLDGGTEWRTPLEVLEKFYHSLGSLLHVATLTQMRKGKGFNEAKAGKLCGDVVAELERVLASRVWNVRFQNRVTFNCCRCQKLVVRSVPSDLDRVVAKCRDCGAAHEVKNGPGGKQCTALGQDVPCLKCHHVTFLFEDEIKQGARWACSKCGAELLLVLRVKLDGT